MKFAIPLAEGKLTAHFGHCQEFALIEVENNEIKNKETLIPPPHEPGVLPRWLHEMGTDVIIAGGMGGRTLDSLLYSKTVWAWIMDLVKIGSKGILPKQANPFSLA